MECLVLGHIVKDVVVRGSGRELRIGGGAYYSALALSKFCLPEIVTSVGEDFPRRWLDGLRELGIKIRIIPSERSTVYELHYTPHGRELFLRSVGEPIEKVPSGRYGLVVLNPVAAEIPQDVVTRILEAFPFVSVDVQGFVRRPDPGRVSCSRIDASFLRGAKVVHADMGEARFLSNFSPSDVEVFLVSRGGESGFAHFKGRLYEFRPLPVGTQDTTGAGDVFLAAFSGYYLKCPFIQALKRAVAFVTLFLKRRGLDFSEDEVGKLARGVEVKRV